MTEDSAIGRSSGSRTSRANVNLRSRELSGLLALLILWTAVVGLLGAATLHAQPRGAPPSELEVKGAFVVNFIRFVAWSSVHGENRADLPVCALSNSDFANAVRRAVAGKEVRSRSISFRIDGEPDVSRCRVLVVDATEYAAALAAIHAVRDQPVLTIGNGPGLIEIGGMFELIVDGRKVRFNTGLDAIRRADLRVSANLLQLSRNLALRSER